MVYSGYKWLHTIKNTYTMMDTNLNWSNPLTTKFTLEIQLQ